jgi:hypothetical protein
VKLMKRISLPIVLFVAVCAGDLLAQSATDPGTGGNTTSTTQTQSVTDGSADSTTPSTGQAERAPEATALDGSGSISMSLIRRLRLLVGGTVAGGYDSDPLNLGTGPATATYSFSPYIGVQAGDLRTQIVVQYHPTISRFTSYAGQSMQVASLKVASSFSPRFQWTLGIIGYHGDDSLRLLEPARSSPGDGIPGPGVGSASFLPNAGTVTDVEAAWDLHYALSERNSLGLHLSDSYNSTPDLNQKGSVATAAVNYTHAVSPTLSLLVYGQNAYYYGDLNCTALGMGVGMRWQAQESTIIELRGGPQIDSPGCMSQQGYAYNASVTRKLPWKSSVYLTADRQPVISFLGSGLWQDDVTGGYERIFQNVNTLSVNAGFIDSTTLVNVSSYRGTYFGASYMRRIHRGLSLQCSYRYFTGRSGDTDLNRNTVQFAITFTPNTRGSLQ